MLRFLATILLILLLPNLNISKPLPDPDIGCMCDHQDYYYYDSETEKFHINETNVNYDNETDSYYVNGQEVDPETDFWPYGNDVEKNAKIHMTIVLVKQFVGLASFFGSAYIIFGLAGSAFKRRKNLQGQGKTFNRFFIGLSIYDLVASAMFFLSTWLIPSYSSLEPKMQATIDKESYDTYFPYASGNYVSCVIQGFLLSVGQFGAVGFTGGISLQYVLQVSCGWRDQQMATFEKIVLVWSILYSLVLGFLLLFNKSIGLTEPNGFCWIGPTPFYCVYYDWEFCEENFDEFSSKYYSFRQAASVVVGVTLIIVIVSMNILFCTVRNQEQRAAQWSDAAAEGRSQKKVVNKALLIIGTFLFMYLPSITSLWTFSWDTQVGLGIFSNLTIPCQGIFNALIYSDKMIKFCEHCCNRDSRATTTTTTMRNAKSKKENKASEKPTEASNVSEVESADIRSNNYSASKSKPVSKSMRIDQSGMITSSS